MSMPPKALPPRVAARTRIRALCSDLEHEPDPKLRAALGYELAALIETREADAQRALRTYREAVDSDATFLPPLFALQRMLRAARDDEALVRVLAKTVQASSTADDQAAALVELGCLLEDRLADPAGARSAFERALHKDPGCLPAACMLERTLRAQHQRAQANALVARRAVHTDDPRLRAALACEAARELADQAQLDAALELLLSALARPAGHHAILLCLAELALRYGRPAIAARACEELAALLRAHAAGEHREPELDERYPSAELSAQTAAFFYREAGRLHTQLPDHARDAVRAYEGALSCAGSDVLLRLEHAAACETAADLEAARADLQALIAQAQPRRAAALRFELAELAERSGDPADALAQLQAAYALAPDAPVIAAVIEDRLLDAGDFDALTDLLAARAQRLDGADRANLLARAAMAAERSSTPQRAISLYERAITDSADATGALREQFGAALRLHQPTAVRDAALRLLGCDLDHAERSAVTRAGFEAARSAGDAQGARKLLLAALQDVACQAWAGHGARLFAALHGDGELLARAHQRLAELAERAQDPELAAAHLCGAARTLVRCGQAAAAEAALQRALSLAPTHAYALHMLEAQLLGRGEAALAVDLLRDAAGAEDDARRSELSLLHAAAAAEAAGRDDLAQRSYDEACDRDPTSLPARWAQLRFAERTDNEALRLLALDALAQRELEHKRPGSAVIELAQVASAGGKLERTSALLTAALTEADSDGTALAAASSAALLARGSETDALRPRALAWLAWHTEKPARLWFEHEQLGELMHVAPDDARTLLAAYTAQRELEPGDALLSFLLCAEPEQRADAFARLQGLMPPPQQAAALTLHAQRARACHATHADTDSLLAAVTAFERAPDALGSALALDEALSETDDPDARVAALGALLAHAQPGAATSLRAGLARALLDAGHPERALPLLNELLSAAPFDASALECVRIAARELGAFDALVAACDALAGQCEGAVKAQLLEEAAAVLHERLSQPQAAEQRLREALRARPERRPAFERLHDLLIEREDLEGLLALLAARIAITDTQNERVDLMYERARIVRARGDREAALQDLEALLAISPAHPGALGLLAEIHVSREAWARAVAALQALARAEIAPAQKRLAREGAADFLDQKLHDPAAAYRELAALADGEAADLALHTRLAELAQRAGLLVEAADALVAAAAKSRGAQRAGFERRAACLQLDALAQPSTARESLRRALLAQPTDVDALSLLLTHSEPAERAALETSFMEALWASLSKDPAQPDALRALDRVGVLTHQPSRCQLALSVLDLLGLCSGDERERWRQLCARLEATPKAVLDDQTFALLLPAALDPPTTRFVRAACAAWLDAHPDTPARRGLTRRMRVPRREPSALREALAPWLQAFGTELGDLYVTDGDALEPLQASGKRHAWVVGRALMLPLCGQQRARIAQAAAAGRAGFLPLWTGEPAQGRELLKLGLAAGGGGEHLPVRDAPLRERAARLLRRLPRPQRRELTQAYAELPAPADVVQTVSQAVVACRLRAAAVAAGELNAARIAVYGSQQPEQTFLETGAAADLLRFWLSPRSLALLEALGMTP